MNSCCCVNQRLFQPCLFSRLVLFFYYDKTIGHVPGVLTRAVLNRQARFFPFLQEQSRNIIEITIDVTHILTSGSKESHTASYARWHRQNMQFFKANSITRLRKVHEDVFHSSLTGSSPSVNWKMGLDQSKPFMAMNSALSSIRPAGSTSWQMYVDKPAG